MPGFSFPPGDNLHTGIGSGAQLILVLSGTERLRIDTVAPWGTVIQETTTQAIANLAPPLHLTEDLGAHAGATTGSQYAMTASITCFIAGTPGYAGLPDAGANVGGVYDIWNDTAGSLFLNAPGGTLIDGQTTAEMPAATYVRVLVRSATEYVADFPGVVPTPTEDLAATAGVDTASQYAITASVTCFVAGTPGYAGLPDASSHVGDIFDIWNDTSSSVFLNAPTGTTIENRATVELFGTKYVRVLVRSSTEYVADLPIVGLTGEDLNAEAGVDTASQYQMTASVTCFVGAGGFAGFDTPSVAGVIYEVWNDSTGSITFNVLDPAQINGATTSTIFTFGYARVLVRSQTEFLLR